MWQGLEDTLARIVNDFILTPHNEQTKHYGQHYLFQQHLRQQKFPGWHMIIQPLITVYTEHYNLYPTVVIITNGANTYSTTLYCVELWETNASSSVMYDDGTGWTFFVSNLYIESFLHNIQKGFNDDNH